MPANSYIPAMVIPSYWGWTSYTPVIPKLYWDVYSQEERIKRLCLEYDKLTHYVSYIAETVNDITGNVETLINDFQESINKQFEEQNNAINEQIKAQDEKVNEQLKEMRDYIDKKFKEFGQGVQVYDITTGTYRPGYQSMRRLFQALSYDHKGDEQLVSYYAQNKTVEDMASITVYNASYSNLPSVVIDNQN